MIVERATHPQFLSNTYLVADREGPRVLRRCGGPVGPLIEAAERLELTPTHVLLTHHHFDHVCEVGVLRERWPELEVLISPLERDMLGSAARARAGAGAGDGTRSRPDRRCSWARSRCARCTRPDTRPGCSRSSWAIAPRLPGRRLLIERRLAPRAPLRAGSPAGRRSCSRATPCSRTPSAA